LAFSRSLLPTNLTLFFSVFSDQDRTKSAISSGVSCETQARSELAKPFLVLRHQFREDLISIFN
jgi:hypothetical protein